MDAVYGWTKCIQARQDTLESVIPGTSVDDAGINESTRACPASNANANQTLNLMARGCVQRNNIPAVTERQIESSRRGSYEASLASRVWTVPDHWL
jgi:hypothetical protein